MSQAPQQQQKPKKLGHEEINKLVLNYKNVMSGVQDVEHALLKQYVDSFFPESLATIQILVDQVRLYLSPPESSTVPLSVIDEEDEEKSA